MDNKELVPLKKKVDTLAQKVEKFEIKSAEDMKEATIVLSTMNQYADIVKEKKESLTKPINEGLRNIRAMFKPLEESYEGAITLLRSKMTVYQTAEVKRKREEEDAIAARVKPGKGNLSVDTALKKIQEVAPVQKEVATEQGLVQFREVRKFEVVDITKLTPEYLLPNETAIRTAMKSGKELAGVRYWTEQVPSNYR